MLQKCVIRYVQVETNSRKIIRKITVVYQNIDIWETLKWEIFISWHKHEMVQLLVMVYTSNMQPFSKYLLILSWMLFKIFVPFIVTTVPYLKKFSKWLEQFSYYLIIFNMKLVMKQPFICDFRRIRSHPTQIKPNNVFNTVIFIVTKWFNVCYHMDEYFRQFLNIMVCSWFLGYFNVINDKIIRIT